MQRNKKTTSEKSSQKCRIEKKKNSSSWQYFSGKFSQENRRIPKPLNCDATPFWFTFHGTQSVPVFSQLNCKAVARLKNWRSLKLSINSKSPLHIHESHVWLCDNKNLLFFVFLVWLSDEEADLCEVAPLLVASYVIFYTPFFMSEVSTI